MNEEYEQYPITRVPNNKEEIGFMRTNAERRYRARGAISVCRYFGK